MSIILDNTVGNYTAWRQSIDEQTCREIVHWGTLSKWWCVNGCGKMSCMVAIFESTYLFIDRLSPSSIIMRFVVEYDWHILWNIVERQRENTNLQSKEKLVDKLYLGEKWWQISIGNEHREANEQSARPRLWAQKRLRLSTIQLIQCCVRNTYRTVYSKYNCRVTQLLRFQNSPWSWKRRIINRTN